MSALEIKGGILDMISKVKDKELLLKLHQVLSEMIEQNLSKTDFWDELTEEQQKELDAAIEESYDEKNHIPHEEVMKKYQKWLKK